MHAPDSAAVQRQIHTRGGQRARVLENSVPTTLVAEGVIDGKGGIVFDRPLTCRVGVLYRLVIAPRESRAREARHMNLRDELEDAHQQMLLSTGDDFEPAKSYFLKELFRVCRADSRLFHCPDDPSREHPTVREWVDTLRATGQRKFLMKFPREARKATARRLTKPELLLLDRVDTLRWDNSEQYEPRHYACLSDAVAAMRAGTSVVFHRNVHVFDGGICSVPIDQRHAGALVLLTPSSALGMSTMAPLYGKVGALGHLVFDKAKPSPGVNYNLI